MDPARSGPNRPGRRTRPSRARTGPWKHGTIPVLGLVGGIGAGKSTVAAALAARGARVIDADVVGHSLLDQRPAREEVVARFGAKVLDPDDSEKINRGALGAIVFAEPKKLRELERILHPRMRRTFTKAIHRFQREARAQVIVLDAAVLFEAGWDDLCDLVAFVEAPREIRMARVASSRGWTEERLRAREEAQLPIDEKRARANLRIRNLGTEAALHEDLDDLWRRLRHPKSPPESSARANESPRDSHES